MESTELALLEKHEVYGDTAMTKPKTMVADQEMLRKLRLRHNQALEKHEEQFMFKYSGEEYLMHTQYAKYLIEYLEARLGT